MKFISSSWRARLWMPTGRAFDSNSRSNAVTLECKSFDRSQREASSLPATSSWATTIPTPFSFFQGPCKTLKSSWGDLRFGARECRRRFRWRRSTPNSCRCEPSSVPRREASEDPQVCWECRHRTRRESFAKRVECILLLFCRIQPAREAARGWADSHSQDLLEWIRKLSTFDKRRMLRLEREFKEIIETSFDSI